MNKYKVEFTEKHFYVIDVKAKDITEALEKANKKMIEVFNNGTYHHYENQDPETEVETVYDVSGTDDPFNP